MKNLLLVLPLLALFACTSETAPPPEEEDDATTDTSVEVDTSNVETRGASGQNPLY